MKKEIRPATVKSNMGICSILFSICLFQVGTLFSQEQVYDNFEGARMIHYGERTGVLDSMAANPAPNDVNKSPKCALYVRNGTKKFANLKMNIPQKLTGVETFATYEGRPPRIKMKCYTTAPAGTLVEILLGSKRGNNDYPAGTHSQYQAYTSVSNEWEELEFKFSQIPQGSETSASQVDQIVLLFNPNSSTSDSYYFDDISGPALVAGATKPIVGETKADQATQAPDTKTETAGQPEKQQKNKNKSGSKKAEGDKKQK